MATYLEVRLLSLSFSRRSGNKLGLYSLSHLGLTTARSVLCGLTAKRKCGGATHRAVQDGEDAEGLIPRRNSFKKD